ncbi:MAG: cysteine hydrolase [Thermoguttaceae bacterium]|nr:cysteine hydrolase [Thermoguttaceae bacterium]
MNAKETAVIFIEFQNDFCHPKGILYDTVKSELARLGTVANARRLLDGTRRAGCKIIHSPFTLDRAWCEAHQVEGLLKGVYDGGVFAPGGWGHEIIDELRPMEGEVVIEGKRSLSAFSHTNLADILRFAGIKNLIVSGQLTNVCAQATAWSAYDLGFRVRMITEACASASREIHEFVTTQVAPIFGEVPTVDRFLASLS